MTRSNLSQRIHRGQMPLRPKATLIIAVLFCSCLQPDPNFVEGSGEERSNTTGMLPTDTSTTDDVNDSTRHLFLISFTNLQASSEAPFPVLNGQQGWKSQGYIDQSKTDFEIIVSSIAGPQSTNAIRFTHTGPGYGAEASRLFDQEVPSPTFMPGGLAHLNFDVIAGHWGTLVGYGYDQNRDGRISGKENESTLNLWIGYGDRSLRNIRLATPSGEQFQSDPTWEIDEDLNWLRLQIEIDFAVHGGKARVFVGDPASASELVAVPGLQDISLGVDWSVNNGLNPMLWDGIWLHFEGAGNIISQISGGSQESQNP